MTARAVPVAEAAFRQAMRAWATGVAVLLVPDDGNWVGMTVNAVASVSLDPPSVLVVVGHVRAVHEALVPPHGQVFTLSVLARRQASVADRFSRHAVRRLHTPDADWTAAGHPVVRGALGWLDCQVAAAHDAGDHTIVVAQVKAGGAAGLDGTADPLLFWAGRYHGGSEWGLPPRRDPAE